MFDLTPEVNLNPKNYRIYRYLQILFYCLAFFSALYLASLIFFPHRTYTFSFLSPNSKKNSITLPLEKNNSALQHGKLLSNQKLIFDTSLTGNYSQALIQITLNRNSLIPSTLTLTTHKSYKSFFYPLGNPIGFKNGTLLKNNNRYYIISHNQLREFANLKILTKLGYNPKKFLTVSSDELQFNSKGEKIQSFDKYPDGALFKIKNNFYLLNQQELQPFSSLLAFKTQYNPQQAITKTSDFIEKYPLSTNIIGFADGTLISNASSVYIISNNHIFPINNAQTFLANGYQWKNIVPAREDELALYKRTSLFKISDPQPNGTIFKTNESKYYLIKNFQKHLLPGKDIAQSWLKSNSPILVSNYLSHSVNCQFKKEFLKSHSYSCKISLKQLDTLLGSDYKYLLTTSKDVRFTNLNINYKKDITWNNFKEISKKFLTTILGKYAQI